MTTETFQFEKQKVIQALRFHFISRKEIRYLLILLNVFVLVSAGLYFFKKITPFTFLAGSFLWMLMMGVLWFILPRIIYNKTSAFRESLQAVIDEKGIMIRNDRGSNQWGWAKFSGWMESPHFFHFYFSSRSFFIIPKSAFNDEDVDHLRKQCREKLGKPSN